MRAVNWFFGAWGQITIGVLFVVATVFQAIWWGVHGKPGSSAIFWLSVEALFFAAYAVIATGVAVLVTQKVMAIVDPDDPTPGPNP